MVLSTWLWIKNAIQCLLKQTLHLALFLQVSLNFGVFASKSECVYILPYPGALAGLLNGVIPRNFFEALLSNF